MCVYLGHKYSHFLVKGDSMKNSTKSDVFAVAKNENDFSSVRAWRHQLLNEWDDYNTDEGRNPLCCRHVTFSSPEGPLGAWVDQRWRVIRFDD